MPKGHPLFRAPRIMPTELPDAPRFHCPVGLAVGATVELPDRAAQHVRVVRLRSGDAVTLFSGDGAEYVGSLLDIGKRTVTALVRTRREASRESPLAVTLIQGLCSGERMDLVIQKATELGVVAIRPVLAARSQARISSDRQERRGTHWQAVAIAACEQCGRNTIPEVQPLVTLADALAEPRRGGSILLSPLGNQTLRSLARENEVTVLVGPEGGLAPREREDAIAAGFLPLRFGPRVLRTETAPLAVIAAMQALWGDC